MNKLRVMSTFSGAGGMDMVFHEMPEIFEFVGFSEIDKDAVELLRYKYPDIPNFGDISKIDITSLPDFDILLGGFPCQDISFQGKMKGFSGEKSSLFSYLADILKIKKPKYFAFENVKAILSSKMGWEFMEVQRRIIDAGYNYSYELIDAADFGLLQNRERVVIYGVREEYSEPFDCGLYDSYWKGKIEDIERSKTKCLGFEDYQCDRDGNIYGRLGQKMKFQKISGYNSVHFRIGKKSYRKLVSRVIWSSFNGEIPAGYEINHINHDKEDNRLENLEMVTSAENSIKYFENKIGRRGVRRTKSGKYRYRIHHMGVEYSKSGYDTEDEAYSDYFIKFLEVTGLRPWNNLTLVAYSKSTRKNHVDHRIRQDGLVNTLTTGFGCNGFSTGNYVYCDVTHTLRFLNPVECERLMAWPDDWTKMGLDDKGNQVLLSDSARYKLCGNGVVRDIMEPIRRFVLRSEESIRKS